MKTLRKSAYYLQDTKTGRFYSLTVEGVTDWSSNPHNATLFTSLETAKNLQNQLNQQNGNCRLVQTASEDKRILVG